MIDQTMQTFCYKCGKISDEAEPLIKNLCAECYRKLHPLVSFPKPLKITICQRCGRYLIRNRWISAHTDSLESVIEAAISESIPLQLKRAPETEVEIHVAPDASLDSILKRNSVPIDIIARGSANEALADYEEEYNQQSVALRLTVCPACLSLKRGDYHAVLHVLTPRREMLDDERDHIFSLVGREAEKWIEIDGLSYITKFTANKGKVSFFIGSEKFARALASLLQQTLGGFLKETYKFGAFKIPKEVKRNKLYISLHLPPFIKGDLLQVGNQHLYITEIHGKKITGVDLETHKTLKFPLKSLKDADILRHPEDIRSFLYFSETREMLQLMDIETFQLFEMRKGRTAARLSVGETLQGFVLEKKVYLISKKGV